MADEKLPPNDIDKINLPSTIQGDGRKFISLLKKLLEGIDLFLNAKVDTTNTIPEQLKMVTVEEKRVSGSITLSVSWNSDDIKKYNGAYIEAKEVDGFHDIGDSIWESTKISRSFHTPRTNQATIDNCMVGKSYWIRVRAMDLSNALSVADKAPTVIHYVSPADHKPLPPREFSGVFDKRGMYWSWKQVEQNQYMWTELRLDTNVGEEHNRLDITNDLQSTAMPPVRQGTAYLYNKGVGNQYSEPAIFTFAKAVPIKPENVQAVSVFEGLRISFNAIPETCIGANIYINQEKHFVTTNTYNFLCSTGEYTVKVAYVDIFGEGPLSDSLKVTTVEEIPPNAIHITDKTVFDNGVIVAKYIGDKQIVGTKIQDGAITTDKLSANSITGDKIQANSIKTEHIATGTITADDIKAGAITTEKISANAVTGDKIVGNSISGDKIQANAISSDKVQAGAIKADKISVDTLSSISANMGMINAGTVNGIEINGSTVNGGVIKGGRLQNRDNTGYIDEWGNIVGMHIKGGTIEGDIIKQAGFRIKSVEHYRQTVSHGNKLNIPNGLDFNNVVVYIYSLYWKHSSVMVFDKDLKELGMDPTPFNGNVVFSRGDIKIYSDNRVSIYKEERRERGESGPWIYKCYGIAVIDILVFRE